MRHLGREAEFRAERRRVVAELIGGIDPAALPELSWETTERLIDLADAFPAR